jgi:hypothetical protein
MSSPKRLKTVHTLPATYNGSVVTVTIEDNRYDPATNVVVSISRADNKFYGSASVCLGDGAVKVKTKIHDNAASSDGTLRCLNLPPEQAALLLENVNPHPLDPRITFREHDHKYWIDGDCDNLVSSTGFIHQFFAEFDSDRTIGYIVRGKQYKNNPDYKYYQKSRDEIKEMWRLNCEQACNAGTVMHAAIEYHLNGLKVPEFSLNTPEWSMYQEYEADIAKLGYKNWRTEQMVFSEDLRLTGSIDMQYRAPDGTIVMADWKRSKAINLKDKFGSKKGKFPFEHLPDCNFSHYCLQLNLYRTFLETWYGEKISAMYLLILHPDQPTLNGKRYHKIMVPRMDEESHLMLEVRRNQLVDLALLKEDDVPYTYRTAEQLGMVPSGVPHVLKLI